MSGDSLYSFSINFNVKITSTYLYYVHDSAIPTYLLFYKCNSFPSIFTKSPDEIVVEAVDFVEAIVLTARRNTLVISPYCVISLVKIFIFIEWLYSTPKVLCYVINIYIYIYVYHKIAVTDTRTTRASRGMVQIRASYAFFATTFDCSRVAVTNLMQCFKHTGLILNRPRTVRPRVTMPHEDQYLCTIYGIASWYDEGNRRWNKGLQTPQRTPIDSLKSWSEIEMGLDCTTLAAT